MKWYLALNEGGTRGDIALHTKLAVLSAIKHTTLEPTLLYIGDRNEFTAWLENRGVTIIDSTLPYITVIEKLVREKRYHFLTLGHWLRTNVCLVEVQDEYVFYSDVDVLFLKAFELDHIRPRFFAAAPEFDKHSWNYFNAGVMVMNTVGMRDNYDAFEDYLIRNIYEKTYSFHDQIAYNTFYRDQWDKLPLELNWKPYWGPNNDAEVLHFHGPKIGAIEAIVDGRWNWATDHGRQIGSLFQQYVDSYSAALKNIEEFVFDLSSKEQDRLLRLFSTVAAYDRSQHEKDVNLQFMKFRMFPTDS